MRMLDVWASRAALELEELPVVGEELRGGLVVVVVDDGDDCDDDDCDDDDCDDDDDDYCTPRSPTHPPTPRGNHHIYRLSVSLCTSFVGSQRPLIHYERRGQHNAVRWGKGGRLNRQ